MWLWTWGPGPVVGDVTLSWPSHQPRGPWGQADPWKGLFPCRTISSPFTTDWEFLPAVTCLSFCSVFSPLFLGPLSLSLFLFLLVLFNFGLTAEIS